MLSRLANGTGGLAFFPNEAGSVAAICAGIALDIRNQYTIGYAPAKPAKPGDYRTIRVVARAVAHGKLFVRTRTGYRYLESTRQRLIGKIEKQ